VAPEKAPEGTPALRPKAIAEIPYVKKRHGEINSIQMVCRQLKLPVDRVDDVFIAYCKESQAAPIELVGLHRHLLTEFLRANTATYGGARPLDKKEFRTAHYASLCDREAQRFRTEFLREARASQCSQRVP
jgi:hypothetical protein